MKWWIFRKWIEFYAKWHFIYRQWQAIGDKNGDHEMILKANAFIKISIDVNVNDDPITSSKIANNNNQIWPINKSLSVMFNVFNVSHFVCSAYTLFKECDEFHFSTLIQPIFGVLKNECHCFQWCFKYSQITIIIQLTSQWRLAIAFLIGDNNLFYNLYIYR